jgi:hypothetical protein
MAGAFGARRKAQSIGPPQPGQQQQQGFGGGEFDPMGGNPMMMGDQLPRPAWSSFDGGRAMPMKLPPLEVCPCPVHGIFMGILVG